MNARPHPGHPRTARLEPAPDRSRAGNVVTLRAAVPIAVTQGTLALDLEPILDPPAALLAPAASHDPHHDLDGWILRFAQAAVEIVSGDRPVSQLVRWMSRPVYLDLERRALLVARAGGHHPGVGRVSTVRPRVTSVRTSRPVDDVAEAAVHVRHGDRSRALAARFELRAGRWICTALEFA